MKALNKISALRKLGLTIAEIQAYLCSGPKALSPVLARKQRRIEIEDRKKSIAAELLLCRGAADRLYRRAGILDRRDLAGEGVLLGSGPS